MRATGQTISHCRITEKPEQGSMGEVHLAQHPARDRKAAPGFLADECTGDPRSQCP